MTLAAPERADLGAAVARDGWAATPPVVPQLALDGLLDASASLELHAGDLMRRLPAMRALAASAAVRAVAEAVLGPHCFAVSADYVDETLVPAALTRFHQRLTISVARQMRVAGWAPWSESGGVPQVVPPEHVLETMLTLRVHLDEFGPRHGPLRVLPSSHRVGRLSPAAIDAWRRGERPVECLAERGAIVAYRPLLLHAASDAIEPGQRRVISLDFAAEELPEPLEWNDRVA